MLIELKDYQQRALDALGEFLDACGKGQAPENVFRDVTQRYNVPVKTYVPVQMPGLAGIPYCCLRIPTGGGKTLMACHAAGIVREKFLRTERAIVLWLVPSNTILDQTARALADVRHPYRHDLERMLGPVEVMTIDEALRLPAATPRGQSVVIITTIQSFRVEDTTGRKVYEQNGQLAEHFTNVPPERLPELEKGPDGKPNPSLVNVLRLHKPIVIVDEAHNARTDLSFTMLGNVAPSCIIEFTATPARERNPSNVIYRASAAELKAEQMIKMPVRVFTRPPAQWRELLAEAVTLRVDLEKMAAQEGAESGEYIRPIVLYQARSLVDSEELKKHLLAEFPLKEEEVKISTSKLDELDGIKDVLSPECNIRHIITVQKLREGWDCPFAYILCSLSETRSPTAIEQIVGRVLRLPHAKRKVREELNQAYAFSVSEHLAPVLGELKEALEANGFTPAEADKIIIPGASADLPLFQTQRSVAIEPEQDLDPILAKANLPLLMGKVSVDMAAKKVTVSAPLTEDEKERCGACFVRPATRTAVLKAADEVAEAVRIKAAEAVPPPARQLEFVVPLLALIQGDLIEPFDDTVLKERVWRLSEKDATLAELDYSAHRSVGDMGKVDIGDDSKIKTERVADAAPEDFVAKLHQQVWEFSQEENWTDEDLLRWLDAHIPHADIPIAESAVYLRKVITGLKTNRGLTTAFLALDRHRLRDVIEEKIKQYRSTERKTAFKEWLLPDSPLVLSANYAVDFSKISYDPGEIYKGSWSFPKHFFGPKPGDLIERTGSGELREEFKCALFIEDLPDVKTWVRNISKRSTSFWLQTSTDKFYPDFVCLLTDGRILVVEYKGKDRWDGLDATEKRDIGNIWAARGGGKYLFVMPDGPDLEAIRRAINRRS